MSKYQFKTEPWDHQRKILAASWNMTYAALLMEYGTGKTKVVIDNVGILYEQNKIEALCVIAPNGVHEQWINEQIPMHFPDRFKYIARIWTGDNTKKFKRSLEAFWKVKEGLKIFTINVEALQTPGRARNFIVHFLTSFKTFLVVDESTRIKNHTASRTKYIMNHLAKLALYRRTLTGNEITRSPFDVYCPYEFLKNGFWNPLPNYYVFSHRYGEWKNKVIPKRSLSVSNFTCPYCTKLIPEILFKRLSETIFPTCPKCNKVLKSHELPLKVLKILENDGKFEFPQLIRYKNLDELRKKTAYCSFLARKEECMDLPPKIYQTIYSEMNDEQAALYEDLKKNLIMEYEGLIIEVKVKIALSIRFQQIVGGFYPESEAPIGKKNPKVESLLYDLEDIDTADPIIIWARFIPEIKALTKRLKKEYDGRIESYYGSTSTNDRSIIRKDFSEGKVRFLVANQATAGTGLNLQRAYINYYFSNSFTAEDRWQSEDRTNRGGQINTCLYKDLFIKGTIDDSLRQSNIEKKNFAEYFKDKPFFEVI